MASATSLALPKPQPTWPRRSPATTNALKWKRRPPFTTFAERLTYTTFSVISPPPRSRSTPNSSTAATGEPSLSFAGIGFAIFGLLSGAILEFQSCFARRVRQRFDTPMIPHPTAVKHDLGNLFFFRLLGGQLANFLRACDGTLRALQLGHHRTCRDQRHAVDVVDQLHVNMLAGHAHAHAWTLCRAAHFLTKAQMPSISG